MRNGDKWETHITHVLTGFSWSSINVFWFFLNFNYMNVSRTNSGLFASPLLFMNKYLDGKFLRVFLCGSVSSEGLVLLTTMCTLFGSFNLYWLKIQTPSLSWDPQVHIQQISLSLSSVGPNLIIFLFLNSGCLCQTLIATNFFQPPWQAYSPA